MLTYVSPPPKKKNSVVESHLKSTELHAIPSNQYSSTDMMEAVNLYLQAIGLRLAL